MLELVPVGPIVALRTVFRLVFGRAMLDTVHVYGFVGLCLRLRRFSRSVRLRAACARAQSFEEWLTARKELDCFEGREKWHRSPSPHFDYRLVERALETLRRVRSEADEHGSPHALAELLMSLVNRKFGQSFGLWCSSRAILAMALCAYLCCLMLCCAICGAHLTSEQLTPTEPTLPLFPWCFPVAL